MPLSNAEKTKRYRERRYAEIEKMEKIPCACGCGTMIPPLNRLLKPAKYAPGHSCPAGWNKGLPNPTAIKTHKGKKKDPASIVKRTATRRAKNGGRYQIKSGWKHTEEARQNMSKTRKGTRTGEDNPFFGKHHTPETIEVLSVQLSGSRNPFWKHGNGYAPYGFQFNRRFKRLIRQRDNYTCQSCGTTQEQYGRTLHIHHKDHDKLNNNPDNLVTVCASCNTWYTWHKSEPFVYFGRALKS